MRPPVRKLTLWARMTLDCHAGTGGELSGNNGVLGFRDPVADTEQIGHIIPIVQDSQARLGICMKIATQPKHCKMTQPKPSLQKHLEEWVSLKQDFVQLNLQILHSLFLRQKPPSCFPAQLLRCKNQHSFSTIFSVSS